MLPPVRAAAIPPVRHAAISRIRGAVSVAALSVSGAACGGAAQSSGSSTVFDPGGAATAAPVDVRTNPDVEQHVAALDGAASGGEPWVGVSILRGGVRFSHPPHWTIRDAGLETGRSFVRYISPNAYSFAIYERPDPPDKSWNDILSHYEADVTASGAKALGQRVPTATATNQGLAYTIDRKIESKTPVLSRSREILLRGDHHIVLVQIVTTEENLSRISNELLELLRRIEVL
jgi:hypothetical protein